jgi:hypothetical protein
VGTCDRLGSSLHFGVVEQAPTLLSAPTTTSCFGSGGGRMPMRMLLWLRPEKRNESSA